MTSWQAAALVALGAMAFLDQWPAVQSMISRPIVLGPVVGAILGSPTDGALWGAVLETMQLAVQPLGAARYPDAGLAGLLGTAAALTSMHGEVYSAGWAIAVAAIAGWGGDAVGRLQRRWNGRTAASVREKVGRGILSAPGRGIALSLSRGAALGVLQTAAGLVIVICGSWLIGGSPWGGPLDARGLKLAAAAMAAVGGVRLFGFGRGRVASLGLGLVAGVALAAWGVAP